jgi:hypothetical protein
LIVSIESANLEGVIYQIKSDMKDKARIYKPCRNPMQSGKANTHEWCLEYNKPDLRFVDPIMGWTGSHDVLTSEVKLSFATLEEAISYAARNNIEYEVFEPKAAPFKIKAYANNYKFKAHDA